MKPFAKICFICQVAVLFTYGSRAQDPLRAPHKKDTLSFKSGWSLFSYNPANQVDLADIARLLLKNSRKPRADTGMARLARAHVSAIPAVGYTTVTGFAVIMSANIAFYTGKNVDGNISTLLTSLTYSQYKQVIFPIQSNIWSKNGKYNYQNDWRYLIYPSYTYGLGGYTILNNGYQIDYSYLRLHQTVSKSITKNLFLGIGFDFDYYWDIQEIDPPTATGKTDFETYGLDKTERAGGITLNFLYDSRKNSVNPDNGSYFDLSYRPKFTFMGSDANWQSLLIEYRGYKRFPWTTDNVLALWSYNWFTFGGKPPYLLLPSTGWDAYVNTGRGYIQGRFRGSDMVYLEAEYRFGITANGLLGGVVFANAETFSSRASTLAGNASLSTFDPIAPAFGLGVRIKMNKFSKANLCIDYGWGTDGSRGVAVNLGEVF